ncbi:MAG: protein kinase [Desulfosarcinaceae bacterium]
MKTIGRYIVRGLLGRGGMGRIYKVELPVVGRISALKLLEPDPLLVKLMGWDALNARFIEEARAMAGLQHPNIAAIHDFDVHGGKPFYTMDFFANNMGIMIGESYRTEEPSRRIDIDNALDYIGQTLEGLACLHAAGIVHRDIKPYNLLVTAGDVIKICDFGLSRQRGERFSGPANLNVGTPFYAAPEQEKDPDSADLTADLYSVGVILYRMVTGHLPQSLPGDPSYTPPSRIHSDLDAAWDDFLSRAMAKQPGRRFVDAASMLTALEQLGEHWKRQKERTCALAPASFSSGLAGKAETLTLRSEAAKVSEGKAQSEFGLDQLWRPKIYIENRFICTETIVRDQATGLIWQQAGSAFPAGWTKAVDYIKNLNTTAHAGITTWRLPTVEELMSLLRPPSRGSDLCLPSLFASRQRWLWSADRKSFISAYYADVTLGFIGWQDLDAPYYARAVCSAGRFK